MDGLATKSSESTRKRKRYMFSITIEGRQRFLEWLSGPTEQLRTRNEFGTDAIAYQAVIWVVYVVMRDRVCGTANAK